MIQTLAAAKGVRNVEANGIAKSFTTENDSLKNRQYYLNNIKRDEACDESAKEGKPVVVAIIDSGIQRDHPDLQGQFLVDNAGNIVGANFVGKGSRGLPDDNWDDQLGHGTHVAGIIAAKGNNDKGVVGVAACKNVKIMPIRVMDHEGIGKSLEIDRGIQWAAAKGADIINLSLGNRSIARSEKYVHSKTLYESLNKQGVIVFAAAGNDGIRNGSAQDEGYVYSYPASYDHVISVSATGRDNKLSSFSVSGDRVDLTAPGEGILSTYVGSEYKYLDGTSMAVPIAAGSYALALSTVRELGTEILYHDAISSILKRASDRSVPLESGDIQSGGIIDSLELTRQLIARFPEGNPNTEIAANPILSPEPEAPQEEEPRTAPPEGEEEAEEDPENPTEEPAPEPEPAVEGMSFVGLESGQFVNTEIKVTVRGWPPGTSRVRLYWITGTEWFPKAFTSLGSDNLESRGRNPDHQFVIRAVW